uniref:Uncharacterized protein n=1 Tax=Arundo donax TaxID=35708 RepID=A0A0A9LHL3_ARUDO
MKPRFPQPHYSSKSWYLVRMCYMQYLSMAQCSHAAFDSHVSADLLHRIDGFLNLTDQLWCMDHCCTKLLISLSQNVGCTDLCFTTCIDIAVRAGSRLLHFNEFRFEEQHPSMVGLVERQPHSKCYMNHYRLVLVMRN